MINRKERKQDKRFRIQLGTNRFHKLLQKKKLQFSIIITSYFKCNLKNPSYVRCALFFF